METSAMNNKMKINEVGVASAAFTVLPQPLIASIDLCHLPVMDL